VKATASPLVLITGASSGIGWALAQQGLQRGWRVALLARRDAELRLRLQAQADWAGRWQVWRADVGDAAAMQAMAQDCLARCGLPDVVIANAGISLGVDTAEAADLPVFEQVMRTNVLGMVHTFQPFIAPMRARGTGRLVGVASVAGIRGLPGHGAYCASKAAAIAYCESLRGELRGSGVGVSTVVPGYVATPLTARNRYPMPFLMQPEDFAAQAWRSIEAGHSYRVIPWPMGVVAKLLRLLPNALLDRLLQGRPRKHRHTED
jgi:NAD(P)-dependent dehydrogenase (short-subunit alcohol dehydrogenase family)